MLAAIGAVAVALLALAALGLLLTLFVKLTTTVGQYIVKKVRESRIGHALASMRECIKAMREEAKRKRGWMWDPNPGGPEPGGYPDMGTN